MGCWAPRKPCSVSKRSLSKPILAVSLLRKCWRLRMLRCLTCHLACWLLDRAVETVIVYFDPSSTKMVFIALKTLLSQGVIWDSDQMHAPKNRATLVRDTMRSSKSKSSALPAVKCRNLRASTFIFNYNGIPAVPNRAVPKKHLPLFYPTLTAV